MQTNNSSQGSIYEADLGGTKVFIQAASNQSTTDKYTTTDGRVVWQTIRREILTPTVTTSSSSVREIGTVQGSPEVTKRLVSCSGVYKQMHDNAMLKDPHVTEIMTTSGIGSPTSHILSPTSRSDIFSSTSGSGFGDVLYSSSAISSGGNQVESPLRYSIPQYSPLMDMASVGPACSSRTSSGTWMDPSSYIAGNRPKLVNHPIVQQLHPALSKSFTPYSYDQNSRTYVSNPLIGELQQRGSKPVYSSEKNL